MRAQNEWILQIIVTMAVIGLVIWANMFSPCWMWGLTHPPARCIKYFLNK